MRAEKVIGAGTAQKGISIVPRGSSANHVLGNACAAQASETMPERGVCLRAPQCPILR